MLDKKLLIVPTSKDIDDFLASREILHTNIKLFHEGHRELHRVIATELRKLLCDGKNTLLPRLFPNVEAHKIRGSELFRGNRSIRFAVPFRMNSNEKGCVVIGSIFETETDPIPLDAWLEQPIFIAKLTVRDFIRSISDKVGAHSDRTYNDTLRLSKSIKVFGEDMHKAVVVAIGEYILQVMENTIQHYPEMFNLDA